MPNFSEGRDKTIIDAIANAISSVPEIILLHIDPGSDANRTVITFVGPPESVLEAAFQGIKTASQLIDMSTHSGAHPRIGATDVCPLIPIAGITMAEVIQLAQQLGRRVGKELGIPVYLYENAASVPSRKNLAFIRKGDYEGLAEKMSNPEWRPDFGPHIFNKKAGATVIGARPFLIAYNVNLNTKSVQVAKQIAKMVRTSGFQEKKADGTTQHFPGKLSALKAIGWYMEDYGCTQVSMNLTDYKVTGLHDAYEAIREVGQSLGVEVNGSELIGMVPLEAVLDAGRYYVQSGSAPHEEALISAATKGLGLAAIHPFVPDERIIEYRLKAG